MNWIRIYWYLSESDSVYAYRTLPVPSQVKQCLLQLLHYPYEVHKLWWFWEFQQCDPHRVPHLSELCMHSPLYEGINICISKPHNYTTSLNTNYHLYKSFMIKYLCRLVFFSSCSHFLWKWKWIVAKFLQYKSCGKSI